ncbi:aspartyl protease family protein At5g10770-like [Zingiber officinale]|uniref:aspartyl protease family protein At5g10770-like n=1 Tax=Zingiber officinale TaxID=94328 RepID=UPI001C4DBD77|nr:aspartyl protease family protein At5g10770-like [Zingiber officinale]
MKKLFLLLLPCCFFLGLTAAAAAADFGVRSGSCSSKFLDKARHLNRSGVHVTLHHPRSPCSPAAPSPDLDFSAILNHDAARVLSLDARLDKSARSSLARPSAVAAPLSPGSAVGVGNYVARIGLGTPSRSFSVLVDTGSSLSWIQCSPCRVSCHPQVGRPFDPAASSTYHPLPCSAAACDSLQEATLNPSACSHSGVCIYEASYGDSSFSVGYLSEDTLTFSSASLPGFVYGCGQDNEGLFGRSDGLIGLARNRLSLLSQFAPSVGNSFAYCLPTDSSAGYLSLGSYDSDRFAFTPLQSSTLDDTLYFVRLAGVSVAGQALSVSEASYSAAPTIIDSGTVITRLPREVYSSLSAAVTAAMKGRGAVPAPAFSILDTCFRGSLRRLAVPSVEMVFQGGAALRLAAANVMIDVDEATTCLAFAPAGRVAIIGNKQQETYSVVYDVGRSRVGFAAGGCG